MNNYAPKEIKLKYEQTEQTRRGDQVHKIIEKAVKGEAHLNELSNWKISMPVIEKLDNLISAANMSELCEPEMSVTFREDKSFTSWFAKDAWCRVSYDLITINGTEADLFDWKTGKVWDNKEQTEMYAGTAFTRFPQLEKIRTHYIFLDQDKKISHTHDKSSEPHIWYKFEEQAEEIEHAKTTQNWPKKPNNFCKWCNVPKSLCEYSQKEG
jgi:hypothetical protein